MSFSTINTILALLALVADGLVLVVAVGFAATRWSSTFRDAWRRLRDQATPVSVSAAWIVGVISTCGSLFLQFGEHLDPCDLCWFQRICMYPQALMLGIAVFAGDRYMVKRYLVPLAAIGSVISVIHIALPTLLAWFGLSTFPGCSLAAPCSVQPITVFGFVTIPYMALSGFLFIIMMLLIVRTEDLETEG